MLLNPISGFLAGWYETPPSQSGGSATTTTGLALPVINLPIALPTNATLYFERQAAGTTIDPSTGNENPNTEIVEISAALRNQRVKMREEREPGLSTRSISLMGFLLGPAELRATLDFSTAANLTLRNSSGSSISGRFFFYEKPSPYSDAILSQIGTPIFGELILAGSGENEY